jgi:hypothetical protein
MGFNYLIDTNILIYVSKDQIPAESLAKIQQIFRNSFNISVISEIELLGSKGLDEQKYIYFKNFLTLSNVYHLNENIKLQTIEIRRKYNIKSPNAIIAATGVINNFVLVTRNVKDFAKIDGLEVYNPFEI